MAPTTVPGPVVVQPTKPVQATPGLLTPRSPVTVVAPVLVTVEPPRTEKLAAVPRAGAMASPGAKVGAALLLSIVTAAPARDLPDTVAPVVKVMLATAKIFPVKRGPVATVSE